MKKIMLWLRIALLLIIGGVALLGIIAYEDFYVEPLNISEADHALVVPPGTSVNAVARGLQRQNILKSADSFILFARLSGQATRIKAGEYAVTPGTTAVQLLDQLVDGDVLLHSLTLIEGWDFKQIMEAVNNHDALVNKLGSLSGEAVMQRLGYVGEHPEGRFLPDTYSFPRGTTDIEFLQRAYVAMDDYLAQAWEKRSKDLPYANSYEALIMASIVEKETGQAFERPQIAGVFVRRLKIGMRLQTDPTVIYGMGGSYDGNIRRRDLRRPTPYNTYVISGMPPTPIASPGRAAIDAALNPADGKALYFVSRNDGTHIFSATLAEHERAVTKYQRGGRSRSQ